VAKDRHHVVPRSRCKQLGINPNFQGNVVKVQTGKHRAWHALFGNCTPDEAIDIIKREWSLSDEGQREYDRLRGNVAPLRRVRCSTD
jgi:hypothetical protein